MNFRFIVELKIAVPNLCMKSRGLIGIHREELSTLLCRIDEYPIHSMEGDDLSKFYKSKGIVFL